MKPPTIQSTATATKVYAMMFMSFVFDLSKTISLPILKRSLRRLNRIAYAPTVPR